MPGNDVARVEPIVISGRFLAQDHRRFQRPCPAGRTVSREVHIRKALWIAAQIRGRRCSLRLQYRLARLREVLLNLLHFFWRLQQRRKLGIYFFRSEEHTSELQSQSNLVCRLLLEKKKHTTYFYRVER